jgi:non-specific serine/threonine protein kinase
MSAIPHNLPIQPTSFIGRAQALTQLKQLLATTHLLTLTGVGGTGKTRLALEVARSDDLSRYYPDGIWFIELAPLADPALVPITIASVLGVREEQGRPLTATLIDWLRERELLLLLDNCEHLIVACAQFADAVLHACPDVCLLATSREALGIAGEQTFQVPSLQLPTFQLPTAELAQLESVRLFVERAHAVKSDFVLSDANANMVAQICQRLDGIPLALELAAARVKALSIEQLAERLDDRFRLLTGGSRTALPRQQTLRAAIDWSYNLLTEPERALLRRLSVFAGGWTLEAAEFVCNANVGAIHPLKVDFESPLLDTLAHLVDKSLIVMEDEGARYRLLETVRQYAREKLLDTGDSAQWHARHCEWFYRLAEQSDALMRSRERPTHLPKLERELDNFRAALEWALASDANRALHFAGALVWFWYFGNHIGEMRQWAERALQLSTTDVRGRARALFCLGRAMAGLGEPARAVEILEESSRLWRSSGDSHGLAGALVFCEWAASGIGDFSVGVAHLTEAIQLYRANGNLWGLALALWRRSTHALACGELTEAHEWCEQSMAVWREVGDDFGLGLTLGQFGMIATKAGDYQRAITYLTDGLASRHTKMGIAVNSHQLAVALFLQGELAAAILHCKESLRQCDEIGNRLLTNIALRHLGYMTLRQGQVTQAVEFVRQSLDLYQAMQRPDGIKYCLRAFAAIFYQQSRWVEAVRLLASAGSIATTAVFLELLDRIEDERTRAALRAQLSEADFNVAWEAGQRLTLDEAVALALSEPPTSNPQTTLQPPTSKPHFGLTPREREVALLITEGLSNREIAEKLVLGERTIETHVSNIFNKLGFTRRAEVRRWVKEKGLTAA